MTEPVSPAFIVAVFLLAGLVKGVTGLGLPTVAVGLLGLAMPPLQAAALMLLPSLVTNVWQMLDGPHLRALWKRLWPAMVGIVIGTALAAGLAQRLPPDVSQLFLGVLLTIYGIHGLAAQRLWRPAPRTEALLSAPVGALTGAVTAMTGVFVLPMVPWLQMLGLPRDQLVQALGLSFTVSTLALAVSLTGFGQFGTDDLVVSGSALAAALAGMWFGQRVRQMLSPETFRRVFFAGLVLLGVWLVIRGLG
jgi:uncharacterized protein